MPQGGVEEDLEFPEGVILEDPLEPGLDPRMVIGPDGVIKKKRGRKPGTIQKQGWAKPGPKISKKSKVTTRGKVTKGKTGRRTTVISRSEKKKRQNLLQKKRQQSTRL